MNKNEKIKFIADFATFLFKKGYKIEQRGGKLYVAVENEQFQLLYNRKNKKIIPDIDIPSSILISAIIVSLCIAFFINKGLFMQVEMSYFLGTIIGTALPPFLILHYVFALIYASNKKDIRTKIEADIENEFEEWIKLASIKKGQTE